jgi:hypothetical protein
LSGNEEIERKLYNQILSSHKCFCHRLAEASAHLARTLGGHRTAALAIALIMTRFAGTGESSLEPPGNKAALEQLPE